MAGELVSVIVPIYNAENYIERCIISVLNQSYPNLELLLVNDGSKDKSGLICESMQRLDSRIRIFTQENSGVSAARNLGLKEAKGRYIAFVDADDVICTDMLQCMVNIIEKERLDLLISSHVDFNVYNDSIFERTQRDKLVKLQKEQFDIYGQYTHSTVWSVLFRREYIRNISFDTNIHVAEDSLFFIQVLLNTKEFGFINRCFYGYNRRADSVTGVQVYNEKKYTEIIAWEKICDIVDSKYRGSILSNSSNAALGMMGYKCLKIIKKPNDFNRFFWNKGKLLMREKMIYVLNSSMEIKTKIMYLCTCFMPCVGIKIYHLMKKAI